MPKQEDLLDVGRRPGKKRPKYERHPVWTDNKAQLIARYLRYFVYVTKHGTYIDGFAGPQEETLETDNWAAKLVLSLQPQRLKHWYLFESNPEQVERLKTMKKAVAPDKIGRKQRDVRIISGDVNVTLPKFLHLHPIKSREATFCLLDQRTAQCAWETVRTLAAHKKSGHKIELFYFLANRWLHRSFKTRTRDESIEEVNAWWGGKDWPEILDVYSHERGRIVAERFVRELGYASAVPMAIYERNGSERGCIMYFMIHATDHPIAPVLMKRAYDHIVEPEDTQTEIESLVKMLTAIQKPKRR